MGNSGSFKKGEHQNPATEFKPGQHWRSPKPFWEREYLLREYVDKGRSAAEIAAEFGCRDTNILYWLDKHRIPRRDVSQARKLKHWGLAGEANGMFGRRGEEVPSWKGGVTPERQKFYSSMEWKAAVRKVLERDRGICQRCGCVPEGCKSISIHHVVPFKVAQLRANIGNLVLLCRSCHRFVHSKLNVNREFVSHEGGDLQR